MYNLFVILVIVASVLMCLIVLIQESKGGGLASGFASGNQVMGVRKTTDVIEKITWGLAIAMVVFSVASVWCLPSNSASTSVMEGVEATAPAVPQTQAPANAVTPEAAQQAVPEAAPEAAPATSDAAAETPEAPAKN